MNKLSAFTWITACLLCAGAVALADDGEAFSNGSATVGGHYYELTDEAAKVGEFLSREDLEDLLPDLAVDMSGGTSETLYRILLLYRDVNTNGFGFDLDTDQYLSASVDYQSFMHNLDHDWLENMQAREQVPDGEGGFKPGGKQVYHTDNDPLGRYAIRYQKFSAEMNVDLPFLKGSRAYSRYHDQRKKGWRQATTISHCAFCHVEGHSRRVDDQVKTWKAGIEGSSGKVAWNYEFGATDYYDRSQTPTTHYDDAMHPVHGEVGPHPSGNPEFPYQAEFGSRLAYYDVTLPFSQTATNEKRSHQLALKVDLPKDHAVKGSYLHSSRKNTATNIEGEVDAYAAGWMTKPTRSTRVSARFAAYKSKVDDVFIDLPNYRDGRPGQSGQDFDWTRISAANRDVWQTDLTAGYRCSKGGYLRASWRHKVVDREAMTISQTSYENVDGTNVEIPAEAFPNETTLDRIKLSLSKRFGLKGNGRLAYTFTSVDMPFMNPTAMCEEGLNGEDHTLAGNGSVYYFQRMRYGNGTNQPNKSHRITARGSYQLSSRTSVNGYLTFATERNDELNIYEFERSVLAPGINLWTAPTDKLMFTAGYAFNSVESTANLCPPIFDG